MNKKIIITGSSGFIGRELTLFLVQKGYHIYAFQRKPLVHKHPNITYVPYSLGSPVEQSYFKEAHFLIHTAYTPLLTAENDSNYSGTKKLIEHCKTHNVNFIFLSTVSAQPQIPSRYAISKMKIEKLMNEQEHLILKLGLVIGNKGLFSKMYAIINKFKIIPIFDHGIQKVQYIGIEDVLNISYHVIQHTTKGSYTLIHPKTLTMKELYHYIALHQKKKRIFISFPSKIAYRILKITETIKIPLPITSENILGLKNTNPIPQKLPEGIHITELQSLKHALNVLPNS